MSQRIRYSKNKRDNNLQSVKIFNHLTNGARYKVILKPSEAEWLVVDADSGIVAASGHMVSLHSMKIEAKKALVKLGIVFTDETRGSNEKASPAITAQVTAPAVSEPAIDPRQLELISIAQLSRSTA